MATVESTNISEDDVDSVDSTKSDRMSDETDGSRKRKRDNETLTMTKAECGEDSGSGVDVDDMDWKVTEQLKCVARELEAYRTGVQNLEASASSLKDVVDDMRFTAENIKWKVENLTMVNKLVRGFVFILVSGDRTLEIKEWIEANYPSLFRFRGSSEDEFLDVIEEPDVFVTGRCWRQGKGSFGESDDFEYDEGKCSKDILFLLNYSESEDKAILPCAERFAWNLESSSRVLAEGDWDDAAYDYRQGSLNLLYSPLYFARRLKKQALVKSTGPKDPECELVDVFARMLEFRSNFPHLL